MVGGGLTAAAGPGSSRSRTAPTAAGHAREAQRPPGDGEGEAPGARNGAAAAAGPALPAAGGTARNGHGRAGDGEGEERGEGEAAPAEAEAPPAAGPPVAPSPAEEAPGWEAIKRKRAEEVEREWTKMTKRKVTDIATVVNHLMRQTAVLLTKDLSKAGGRQAAAPAPARGQQGEVPVTPASAKRVAESVNRSAAVTVDRIMQMKYAYPFNAPVDAEALGLGDYFKVITHPMDLGTIKRNAQRGAYREAAEVSRDVRLVFENAMKYNPPGSDVWVMATSLFEKFHEIWRAKLPPRFAEDEQQAKQEEQGAHRKLQDAHRARDVALSRKRSEEYLKHLSHLELYLNDIAQQLTVSCSQTDASEKRKLGETLNKLPPEFMEGAVRIVSRRHPELTQMGKIAASGELKFNIDTLDPLTVRQLQRYAQEANTGMKLKSVHGAEIDSWSIGMESISKAALVRHRELKGTQKAAREEPAGGQEAIDILG